MTILSSPTVEINQLPALHKIGTRHSSLAKGIFTQYSASACFLLNSKDAKHRVIEHFRPLHPFKPCTFMMRDLLPLFLFLVVSKL